VEEKEAREQVAVDLLAAGVRRGGAVLVHSSLKSMGHVPGGPETVIRGLLGALGPEGTLLMPALSYVTVKAEQPVFDVLKTPSCVGAIPEYFRTRPGTIRSVHPTHSVCGVGARAAHFLGDHQRDNTPAGENSPYRRLRDECGQILMLGCGLWPNTSMHGVEELVEPPYLFAGEVTYEIILLDGRRMDYTCRRHDFAGYRQRYDRVAGILSAPALQVGMVLEATVHVLDCATLWEQAEAALRAEPLYFVEAVGPTP